MGKVIEFGGVGLGTWAVTAGCSALWLLRKEMTASNGSPVLRVDSDLLQVNGNNVCSIWKKKNNFSAPLADAAARIRPQLHLARRHRFATMQQARLASAVIPPLTSASNC